MSIGVYGFSARPSSACAGVSSSGREPPNAVGDARGAADLFSRLSQQTRRALQGSEAGGPILLDRARAGDGGAKAFLDDLIIADAMRAALARERAWLAANRMIRADVIREYDDALLDVDYRTSLLINAMAEIVRDAEAAGEDARWTKYREHAADFAQCLMRLAASMSNARDRGMTNTHPARDLFDMLYEHITLPYIAERKGCTRREAADHHVDGPALAGFRAACGGGAPRFRQDPFRSLCGQVAQALYVYTDACHLRRDRFGYGR
ncbi:hypothetical protein MyNCGM683_06610 [Achromobacter xylosoxidans]